MPCFAPSSSVLVLSCSPCAGRARTRPGGPRVRAQDGRIAKFINDGVKRSPTLRALVDRIEASNVIVYVGAKPLMKTYLSGTLSFVTTAGSFRYVRAAINADLLPDQMIATLAHEFQHVVEVIDAPSVVDDDSLVKLYRRIGVASSERQQTKWETTAAQAMGAQVRRELMGARPAVAADVAALNSFEEKL
jgi:hypothetical protein